ncbi:hypothetical protein MPER_03634, partial [Moniliophthora perniciosa FA553]
SPEDLRVQILNKCIGIVDTGTALTMLTTNCFEKYMNSTSIQELFHRTLEGMAKITNFVWCIVYMYVCAFM